MPNEDNIGMIMGLVLIFSFLSIFFLSVAILHYATVNDYVLYNMQNATEEMYNQGIVSADLKNWTEQQGEYYRTTNLHLDDLWFLIYVGFVLLSIGAAYLVKPINNFGFLTMLFYGIMFLLFILTIMDTLTDWFNQNILLNLLPNVVFEFPKFYYYLDHIGLFSAIHLVVIMVVNVLDFDISKIKGRRKQEEAALGEEII